MRKKVCSYCGKIVTTDHVCDKRPKDNRKKNINVDSRWRKVRQKVRERDLCCVLCMMNGHFTNYDECHHIVPREVNNNESMVFNKDNCVMLCHDCHHKVHNEGWLKYADIFEEYVDSKK